ncbi:YqaJ viral recombinase family protein [Actinomadura sp. KC216]|uniref:YqaJ viral recombinase family nuclease n=1 Tax=Actinomadura sp. KC216 TaxID=2530370 RepID=UPI00140522BB|nr:YqaJ viral recombinase family protein [Actinomadura sp. KC216]
MTGRRIGAAVEVLPHDADRDQWLAARRPLVTASDIGVLLGISPYGSPFNLHWVKRGEIPEDIDNERLSLGRHLEPWVADRFAAVHPEYHVERAGLVVSTERGYQGATPDRVLWTSEGDMVAGDVPPEGALEIKTSATFEEWGPDGSDEVPPYIRAQALWQLDTMDLPWVVVACLFLLTQKIRVYRIERDETDIALMRERAAAFLADVAAERVPDIDHTEATAQALSLLYPLGGDGETEIDSALAADYREAKAELDAARVRYDLLTNRVRAAMGEADAKYAMSDGTKVAVRSVYPQSGCDMDRLRARHPGAYADCRTTHQVDKITPSKIKKEAA